MLTLSDLLKALTPDEVKATIYALLAQLGIITTSWKPGAMIRTIIAIFAQVIATLSGLGALIAASGFLDTCSGNWLTLLAKQVYNVDRILASFAAAPNAITLTNTGGGLYVIDPGDLVFQHATTGKTYRNTSGGTLNPLGTLVLDIQAEEAGTASNADIGSITVLVTSLLGVTCTNTVTLRGIDEEGDESLRSACRKSLALLGLGGVPKAYEFVATRTVRADGTSVGVTRVKVMPAVGDGTVTIYVAGASGAIPAEDLALVQADFDTKVTPYGFTATALSATAHPITAPCTIWIPSSLGMAEADAQNAIDKAMKAYVETLPINGTVIPPSAGKVFWRALLGVIEGAIPSALQAQLTSETDIAIATGEVPTYLGSPADYTIVQVAA